MDDATVTFTFTCGLYRNDNGVVCCCTRQEGHTGSHRDEVQGVSWFTLTTTG